jgi:hypothetical protein
MPYAAEISRTNPTCLLFLVDQSSSMDGEFGGQPGKKKSEGLADAINRLLQNLVLKCAKADGVRDYFHVGVIGYHTEAVAQLANTDDDHALAPISQIADKPIRVETRTRQVDDGSGGVVEQQFRFPVWFEPAAGGKTAMCAALELARRVVADFLAAYPNCYPPLVVNLTDGQPTDGNPLSVARELRSMESSDGKVLLFNGHLSSQPFPPLAFPGDETGLPDVFAKLLYRMSSKLPPRLRTAAAEEGYPVTNESRGFVFNADLVAVIRFLEIGTRVATTLR